MQADRSDTVLEVHGLSKQVSSPEGTLAILDNVEFSIGRGETVAVMGASGAGKSTLLALLAGLDTPMSEAILIMSARPFGCVGIVDGEGSLVGIVTDGDLRRHMQANLLTLTARQVMTPAPKTIRPQALAAEAVGYLNANRILSLFVVEGGKPVGLVQLYDCLRAGVS